jgi:drug/metabolite transporter (DMT)-like permease
MNSPLSYDTKMDWGNKTLPPKYVTLYGVIVLLLMCAYLWKFHQRHAPVIYQGIIGALAIAVVGMLIARWRKDDRINQFLFWFMLAQIALQTVALVHSW